MKNWKTMTTFVVLCAMALGFCGCSTFTPRSAGEAAGMAAYLGYQRVAADKDPEFQKSVAELWDAVDKIETIDDLRVAASMLADKYEAAMAKGKLNESELAMLNSIRDILLVKVEEALESKMASNKDAVEFLLGVRDGVNKMRALDKK